MDRIRKYRERGGAADLVRVEVLVPHRPEQARRPGAARPTDEQIVEAAQRDIETLREARS